MNPLAEDEWLVPIDTNGSLIPYKLDTGAQVNILSRLTTNSYIKIQLHNEFLECRIPFGIGMALLIVTC